MAGVNRVFQRDLPIARDAGSPSTPYAPPSSFALQSIPGFEFMVRPRRYFNAADNRKGRKSFPASHEVSNFGSWAIAHTKPTNSRAVAITICLASFPFCCNREKRRHKRRSAFSAIDRTSGDTRWRRAAIDLEARAGKR